MYEQIADRGLSERNAKHIYIKHCTSRPMHGCICFKVKVGANRSQSCCVAIWFDREKELSVAGMVWTIVVCLPAVSMLCVLSQEKLPGRAKLSRRSLGISTKRLVVIDDKSKVGICLNSNTEVIILEGQDSQMPFWKLCLVRH